MNSADEQIDWSVAGLLAMSGERIADLALSGDHHEIRGLLMTLIYSRPEKRMEAAGRIAAIKNAREQK